MESIIVPFLIIVIAQIVSAITLIDYSKFEVVRRRMRLYLAGMLIYAVLLVLGLPIYFFSNSETLVYGLLVVYPFLLFLLHIYALCLSVHLKRKSAVQPEIPELLPSDAAQ